MNNINIRDYIEENKTSFYARMHEEEECLMSKSIHELATAIHNAKTTAILTGAGMSTESDIPDFRSSDGIYSTGENLEKLLSKSYFESKPKEFWKVYKDVFNIKIAGDYVPNSGHNFLASLEKLGKKVSIITQNVDGLHTAAGSTKVYEVHGNMKTAECVKCGNVYDLDHINDNPIPRCTKDNFILKPNVVLFGDMIKDYKLAEQAIFNCDLLLVLGSSLNVFPVASFPQAARDNYYKSPKFKMAIINRDVTKYDSIFDYAIHRGIGETLMEIGRILI